MVFLVALLKWHMFCLKQASLMKSNNMKK